MMEKYYGCNTLQPLENSYTNADYFEVTSGALVVSDPCYPKGTWCASTIPDVKNGKWKAFVDYNDEERVCHLCAYHEDYILDTHFCSDLITTLGVDSGQMGIFDEKFYKNDAQFGDDYPENPVNDFGAGDEPGRRFYGFCCDETLSEMSGGLLPYGCVSNTGFGDGCYEGVKLFNVSMEVIGIEIEFIYLDEEDDESIYDEEEDF